MREFTAVQRPWNQSPAYLHNEKPVFIIGYEAVEGVRAAHFQAYRSVIKVPAGRMPWTVDNRRIGTDRGFPTLDAAMAAASQVAA